MARGALRRRAPRLSEAAGESIDLGARPSAVRVGDYRRLIAHVFLADVEHCSRCSGPMRRTPRLCDDAGQWRDQRECLVECARDGICTGECSGDERRCAPETRRPQTCDDNGARENANACSGQDVCVTATGSCGSCRFDSDCSNFLLCFDGECAVGDCLDDDECPRVRFASRRTAASTAASDRVLAVESYLERRSIGESGGYVRPIRVTPDGARVLVGTGTCSMQMAESGLSTRSGRTECAPSRTGTGSRAAGC